MLRILGGTLKGHPIKTPKTLATRPVTSLLRKSMFDICQFFIENARVLDAFAGSGAIGLEALSRDAGFVYFIDTNPIAIRCVKENLESLKLTPKARLLKQDAFHFLETYEGDPFDILFLDPPYPIGLQGYTHLLEILSHSKALTSTSHIFLEAPSNLTLPLPEKRKSSGTILYYFSANDSLETNTSSL